MSGHKRRGDEFIPPGEEKGSHLEALYNPEWQKKVKTGMNKQFQFLDN
ncbi:hypothetical protein SAMN05443144_1223 [Fodinibius roseus]|uniref:Uncharacterized protein n=1 Tax=Fodinibius roseus TaxID=1194090 RepID=A0A1M5I3D2_9BACT|nr:hypothetical protein [Fodinibius roseus]SHG22579.1 hypothetical protein SAMN05443144_1223 [Fodinibius roseus]